MNIPVVSDALWSIVIRVCLNIIRICEQILRELLGFYVLGDMANEINFIACFIQWYLCHFIQGRINSNYVEKMSKIGTE